jgi:hypothetical protein
LDVIRSWRMRLNRRVGAYLGLVAIAICLLMVAAIFKAHKEADAQARLRAAYLAEALAEDVARVLELTAGVSEAVKERFLKEGNIEFLDQLKQQIQKYVHSLTDIAVIGADGRLVATTVPEASKAINFSDREYFIAHRDDPRIGFRVGVPTEARPPGRIIVPITRRLETESGAFAGVALFTFDPEVFASVYQHVDVGRTGSLEVIGTDGIMRAGYSISGGERRSLVVPFAAAQSSPAGSLIKNGRFYAWRKLDSFPLVAVVSLGEAEAMGGAYRQAILLFGLGALTLGLLIAIILILSRDVSAHGNGSP